jgi:hypothetical protein
MSITLLGAGQRTNTPAGINISGYVMDALRPATPVSGVTVTMTGGATGSTTTNASGFYSFTNVVRSGNIILTCTKPITPALTTGNFAAYFAALGIGSADATRVDEIFRNVVPPTSNYQRLASDIEANNLLNNDDRFYLNTALAGDGSSINVYNTGLIRRFFPTTYTPPTTNSWSAITETITVTATTGSVTASWWMTTKGDVVI